jgi:hypothetical protein
MKEIISMFTIGSFPFTCDNITDKSNTTGATCGPGIAYTSGALGSVVFSGVSVARFLVFYARFYRCVFVLLPIALSVLRLDCGVNEDFVINRSYH